MHAHAHGRLLMWLTAAVLVLAPSAPSMLPNASVEHAVVLYKENSLCSSAAGLCWTGMSLLAPQPLPGTPAADWRDRRAHTAWAALSSARHSCGPCTLLSASCRVQIAYLMHTCFVTHGQSWARSGRERVVTAATRDMQANALRQGEPTKFFEDEFRSYVLVTDIVQVIKHLLSTPEKALEQKVFNMGGPDRLSRADFASAVAEQCGLSTNCIVSVPAASITRAVKSPADISMDSSKLQAILPFQISPCAAALKAICNS